MPPPPLPRCLGCQRHASPTLRTACATHSTHSVCACRVPAGGHDPLAVYRALRGWLAWEWARKAGEAASSVPRLNKDVHGEGPPLGEGRQEVWASYTLHQLPQQDNHCDCGLFLLAYTEFFCHAAPHAITTAALDALAKRKKSKRGWA